VSSDRSADATEAPYVSTGYLPSPDIVRALVSDAHERFGKNKDGQVSDVYPALASVPQDLFGLCVVGVSGAVFASGDWDIPFSIMSVSKPFVFALVLQVLAAEATRGRLGVNATGLPFNSLAAVERSTAERIRWSTRAPSPQPVSLRVRRSKSNGGLFSMVCRDLLAARLS
jgi:glutaminase